MAHVRARVRVCVCVCVHMCACERIMSCSVAKACRLIAPKGVSVQMALTPWVRNSKGTEKDGSASKQQAAGSEKALT